MPEVKVLGNRRAHNKIDQSADSEVRLNFVWSPSGTLSDFENLALPALPVRNDCSSFTETLFPSGKSLILKIRSALITIVRVRTEKFGSTTK